MRVVIADDSALLREGLARLQSTTIVTNIRVKRGKKHRQFSWIESWTDLVDEETDQSKGMSLTLSEWFHEGIMMDGGLLSVDPVYFSITGGRERWLYRVARKHSGGAGEWGFAIPLQTLFGKSGAEGTYRRFKFEIQALVRRNDLPGFTLALELGRGEPLLRMARIETAPSPYRRPPEPPQASAPKTASSGKVRKTSLPLFRSRTLSPEAVARIHADFPGWDVDMLRSQFDAWLGERHDRSPKNYEAAFYGFVRRIHARGA